MRRRWRRFGVLAGSWIVAVALLSGSPAADLPSPVQFVFTSDAHYGLWRDRFRGAQHVSAHVVNAAMIDAINRLSAARLPDDGGLRAGLLVGGIDFLAEGGDIANRQEDGPEPIQPAQRSWEEFQQDYVQGLALQTSAGTPTPVFMVPGNHDASNALGFYRGMMPPVDASAMAGIFNLMLRPVSPRTPVTFSYADDAVFFSRDVGGVHIAFVQVWPDSKARRWLDDDLSRVSQETPVILVTHDQPDVEAKHFKNPNGAHDINAHDRFENLLADALADGRTIDVPTTIEQGELEAFFHRHSNLTGYFHGNSNWNEFYDWTGPNAVATIHAFRVDSPMKGAASATDERRLSFHVVTIDPRARTLTARECLWNAHPEAADATISWGASRTVSLTAVPASAAASVIRRVKLRN